MELRLLCLDCELCVAVMSQTQAVNSISPSFEILQSKETELKILKIPSFSQHFAEYSEAVPSGPSCQALSEAAREHQVTGTDQGGSSGSNNLLGVPCGWVDS